MDENLMIRTFLKEGKVVFEEKEITDMLDEICDRVHAGCSRECPVYTVHKGVPKSPDGTGCRCFRNGPAMLAEIKKSAGRPKNEPRDRTLFFTFDGAVLISADNAHKVREILEDKKTDGKFSYTMKELTMLNKGDKESIKK
jgi:hypothetical protein